MTLAIIYAILSFLITTSLCALQYYSEYQEVYTMKKGLTFQATVWPEEKIALLGECHVMAAIHKKEMSLVQLNYQSLVLSIT